MEHKNYIQSYCTIQKNKICLNGVAVFEIDRNGFADFSKKAYQYYKMDYPKFFKMDSLSKLAFIAAELVMKNEAQEDQENNTAVVLSNKSSSLDTDVRYQRSISDDTNYFPSPAVFVYTLANICLGEISIRHQLKSENSFFIFDSFNPEFMESYAQLLLETKKADKVLCGWVEYFNEDYKAFLYLVGPEGTTEHNKETLQILYNQ